MGMVPSVPTLDATLLVALGRVLISKPFGQASCNWNCDITFQLLDDRHSIPRAGFDPLWVHSSDHLLEFDNALAH